MPARPAGAPIARTATAREGRSPTCGDRPSRSRDTHSMPGVFTDHGGRLPGRSGPVRRRLAPAADALARERPHLYAALDLERGAEVHPGRAEFEPGRDLDAPGQLRVAGRKGDQPLRES